MGSFFLSVLPEGFIMNDLIEDLQRIASLNSPEKDS